MEETGTRDTKVSDSGCSNSCNSQSQRSSRSSESRHSNSSGSSGYCGHAPSTQGSSSEPFSQPSAAKHNKDKEHKKKKLKSSYTSDSLVGTSTSMLLESEAGEEMEKSDKLDHKLETEISCDRESAPLPPAATAPEHDTQLATLQQTLSCIQNSKKKERNDVSPVLLEENECHVSPREIKERSDDHQDLEETSTQSEGEFSVVVSMQDGVVVYTTPNLTEIAGFPKDMWIGRSFIDFVHPKDKEAFTSHITSGMVTPLMHTQHSGDNLFCCRLRKYRGLKSSGYGVTQKEVTYLPFLLKMSLVEFPVSYTSSQNSSSTQGSRSCMYLIIRAKQLTSAFKYSEETRVSPKFVTHHLASCKLSHVDPEMVPYIGYLPQELIGNSVLDFCHPEDLPFLKEVYQRVMREQGAPFCSKPYRFKAQNGNYVMLETEWSSFFNPWTHKLEFVIGHHRILKGPKTADVFTVPNNEEAVHISEEVLKESKIIEEEIKALLNEKVTNTYHAERQQMSKRCADLANLMESLIADPLKTDLKLEMPQEGMSFSERDSVMLGEISPHHDYCDSKSSSETPPSYSQLNYNDNIQRFFESKPKTTHSDESVESKTEVKAGSLMSTDEDGKSGPVADSSGGSSNNRKCCSSGNDSGSGHRSGHGSGHSSGSGGNGGDSISQPATKTSNNSYKPPVLTKALLCRHNEDMEKRMVKKHREQRNKGLDRENKQKKCSHDKNAEEQCHGLKRSGSHSWEGGDAFRSNKHLHTEGVKGTALYQEPMKQGPAISSQAPPTYNGGPSINLWPPFSVTVAPLQYSQPCSSHGYAATNTSPMFPLFYIPSGPPQMGIAPQEHPGPPPTKSLDLGMISGSHTYVSPQAPYMTPPMMYQYPTPMYSGLPMMFPAMAMPQPTPSMFTMQSSIHNTVQPCNKENKGSPDVPVSAKFQRPASQATSVKAEPGSAIGSIASASVKRGMSETSKKDKSLCSPGGEPTSAELSQDDERRNSQGFGLTNNLDGTCDDSTFSSFYSFLQMEKSDCSMKSSTEEMVWEKSESHKSKPRPVLKEPSWMEGINVTSDLVYRYQIKDRVIGDVLKADMKALECINQPLLVNDQLSQLYRDMELEGLSNELKLEEGITSSSGSSGEEQFQSCTKTKKKQRKFEYGKLVMIFEENAPLPPPPCTS